MGTWEVLLAFLRGRFGRRWGAAWRGGKRVSPVKSGGCAVCQGEAAVPPVVGYGRGVGGAANPIVGAGAAGRAMVRRQPVVPVALPCSLAQSGRLWPAPASQGE